MLRTSVTRKAASVKAGAALAVCMLALTTTACSNSERESDALADAPSAATDTNRDVPPEINEFLEGDEGRSVTYIRLHDGMHMGSASEHEPRPALSLIKLYIATYVMEKGEYEDKYEALDMIASSSDKSAEELFDKYPDSIDTIADEFNLESTKAGEQWGYSQTSTYDVASFISQLIDRDETHPVLVAMAHADPISEDGYRQDYGTAKLSNVVGSKWGWSNDKTINSSVSFGENFVAAASITGSSDDLTDYVKDEVTGKNLGKATERFLKYKDGEDVPPIETSTSETSTTSSSKKGKTSSKEPTSESTTSKKKSADKKKGSETSSEPSKK
ncbi:hypothetical protein [Corynebacterium tuberculostearicum]|uniref:hypothetical protein n=1 Tax=Corynebacterium tuberculostearicum TaxID=38304 RepID=UPI0026496BEF|nr:hypothetical protein [Corynebacterium tuberculostearicum]MDV2433801.1 hypothetical protein [Corynebacterium tuberculostearicum]